jgi:predicted sulfurtransferase
MSEKGYDNVFLLSGGIENFNEEFTEMVEGKNVPKPRRIA